MDLWSTYSNYVIFYQKKCKHYSMKNEHQHQFQANLCKGLKEVKNGKLRIVLMRFQQN